MQQNITQLNVRVPQEIKDFLQEGAKKELLPDIVQAAMSRLVK